MLIRHAYSWAVSGHLLVQLVVVKIVLEGINVSEKEKKEISTMLTKMEKVTPDII